MKFIKDYGNVWNLVPGASNAATIDPIHSKNPSDALNEPKQSLG